MSVLPPPVESRESPLPTPGRKRRSPVRKALIGLLVCAATLALVAGGGILYLEHRISSHIGRIDGVFTGLEQRPARPTSGPAAKAVNILLLGTDRRSTVATTGSDAAAPAWLPGEQRSDTIMVVHIDGDRRGASVISIPRDSWVRVPGYGGAKINAAFSFEGPNLAVATVESLTGLHIDHLAVVDWDGFKALTDAVGGVDVIVPRTVTDSARGITWTAGEHKLDGVQALAYVGQRYGLPGGDLDRVKRQQAFLRTLMQASLHQEMRKNPRMVYDFLDTVSQHLSVDAGWTTKQMASLALSLRDLRSGDIHYLTVPVAGLGWVGDQSIVRLQQGQDQRMWNAVRNDRIAAWLQHHPGYETPVIVN